MRSQGNTGGLPQLSNETAKFFDDLYPGLKKAVESTLYQYYQGQLQGSGANETARTPSSMLTTGEEQVSSVTTASIQTQTLPPGRSPPKGSIKIPEFNWPALWVIRALRRVLYDPWTKSNIRQLTSRPGSAAQAPA